MTGGDQQSPRTPWHWSRVSRSSLRSWGKGRRGPDHLISIGTGEAAKSEGVSGSVLPGVKECLADEHCPMTNSVISQPNLFIAWHKADILILSNMCSLEFIFFSLLQYCIDTFVKMEWREVFLKVVMIIAYTFVVMVCVKNIFDTITYRFHCGWKPTVEVKLVYNRTV